MKFLCGRPGCGKESTATLQIDAPSETVSLVDPRISRDGVPLCARHADATTPPMGWTMNDLRSRNRSLAAVPDEGSVPTSTPPRVRPAAEASGERRMSPRQSIAARAGQVEADGAADDGTDQDDADHRFANSRPDEADVATGRVDEADADEAVDEGPASRPNRRRDVAEEGDQPEESFPWHFGLSDEEDEPAELHASSPLLSRAFRATTG